MTTETIQLLTLIISSVTAIVLAWISYKTSLLTRAQREIVDVQKNVEGQIVALEKNTNSIKDALVLATAKLSHAEGKLEGKVEAQAEQAVFAKGVLAGPEKVKKE